MANRINDALSLSRNLEEQGVKPIFARSGNSLGFLPDTGSDQAKLAEYTPKPDSIGAGYPGCSWVVCVMYVVVCVVCIW